MKIAHILPHYPGKEGTTAFCRGLVGAMSQLQVIDVEIVSFRNQPEAPVEDGIPIRHYRLRSRNPFALPKAFKDDLSRGNLGYDGVVLHGTYNTRVMTIARLCRRYGIPYIFVPHDPYVDALKEHNRLRKAVYWRLFEEPMINSAAAVQLLAEEHEAPLRAAGVRTPTFIVGNGCDPAALRHVAPDAQLPGARESFVVQYLGRMDRNHKGLDLLIRGFDLFCQLLPDATACELRLSGNDWEDRGELEELAKSLPSASKIHFTGRLPEHSLHIQSLADVCVLTSRFDGFGLTIVEAMLAGRPVLVSSEAGVAGDVRKSRGGKAVSPDPEAIAGGLRELFEQRDELPAMGLRGQKYVTAHLTWEQVARQSIEAYRRYFPAVSDAPKACR